MPQTCLIGSDISYSSGQRQRVLRAKKGQKKYAGAVARPARWTKNYTYVVAAIIAILKQYLRKTAEWRPDIRIECLCWVILYLGLRLRRKFSKLPASGPDNERLSPEREFEFNWMAWSTSLFVAIARVLTVYCDTTHTIPLAVLSTYLALLYRNSHSPTLPKPGGHNGVTRPKSQLRHSVQLFILSLLGISSLYLFVALQNGSSILLLFLSVLATSSSFFLLDTCNDYNKQLPLPKLMEAIVLRVCLILLGVLLVIPPPSMLAWSMILQAFCTSAGLTATVCLVLSGHTLAATTIDSYSAAAVQGFLADTFEESLIMPVISVTSLTFGVTNLPPRSTRRWVLAIVIIPMLPILTRYPESWRIMPSKLQISLELQPEIGLDSSVHPIRYLAAQAESRFNTMIKSQSQTLSACCAEYERRYGRKAPIHFDKWFRAAQKQGFLLTDEFDSMMSNLEPLWGVAPSDIRARLENVIAASQGEGMYRFTVSQGPKPEFHNPPDWMGQIFSPWFDSEILQTLPNMTLAMNTMDEPKVVVPHDMLSLVLSAAQNSHEGPPGPGKNSNLAQHVDFLNMGKQNTWDALSLSCPPDTAARDFSLESTKSPFLTRMGFLSNVTLSKDVCEFPELHNIHAGLRHPESMTITHALVPVFSQAKATCFNDLLYPSPFYAEKLRTGEYKEKMDLDWEEKENIVYWTGSNTGGHSTTENWRSLQRQRLALITMDGNHPITLLNRIQQPQGSEWKPINSTFAAISNSTRVRISAAIQCDNLACEEQNDELKIKSGTRDDIADGYKARYNLDIDGNGLSGRFYRLLMSKSAVLKQTLYQEWHDDWLIPWLHYIPISMDLRDFPEIVRYLTQEPEGQTLGKKVAQSSYDWSRLVLRSEDMRLFWWRLMLEYGRLMSDDRDQMWYSD